MNLSFEEGWTDVIIGKTLLALLLHPLYRLA